MAPEHHRVHVLSELGPPVYPTDTIEGWTEAAGDVPLVRLVRGTEIVAERPATPADPNPYDIPLWIWPDMSDIFEPMTDVLYYYGGPGSRWIVSSMAWR